MTSSLCCFTRSHQWIPPQMLTFSSVQFQVTLFQQQKNLPDSNYSLSLWIGVFSSLLLSETQHWRLNSCLHLAQFPYCLWPWNNLSFHSSAAFLWVSWRGSTATEESGLLNKCEEVKGQRQQSSLPPGLFTCFKEALALVSAGWSGVDLASSCGSAELLGRNNKGVIYMCFSLAAAAEPCTLRAVVCRQSVCDWLQ